MMLLAWVVKIPTGSEEAVSVQIGRSQKNSSEPFLSRIVAQTRPVGIPRRSLAQYGSRGASHAIVYCVRLL